jgi:hypothetical protein
MHMHHGSLLYLKSLSRPLFGEPLAGITEILDPKGLREGMNRQDIYREGQKADDQLAIFFIFLSKIYTKVGET